MRNTYTKVTDFSTIITRELRGGQVEVFVVFADGESTTTSESVTFEDQAAANLEVKRLATRILNATPTNLSTRTVVY